MKIKCLILILLQMLIISCDNKFDVLSEHSVSNLPKYSNLIPIDSTYTYQGDSLYVAWLDDYNANTGNITTRALSPEDDAFFSKKYIVKSTEMTLLYGRNYIYPSAILEGNSISGGQLVPIYVAERNPITVSMSLTHNTPKSTRRTIESPTFSKLNDYVKEMVVDGNFQQNEKFMFQLEHRGAQTQRS